MKLLLFVCLILLSYFPAVLNGESKQELVEKDLAIALSLDAMTFSKSKIFPKSWHQKIHESFNQTSAGPVLETESPYSDWQIVSMRFAPCAPLRAELLEAESLCWPELRLVWQPILRKVRLHERYMEAAAEDRAIHAIYPINPATILPLNLAQNALMLLEKIAKKEALALPEQRQFEQLRDSVIKTLSTELIKLRDPKFPEIVYRGIDVRPEMQSKVDRDSLVKRLDQLVQKFCSPRDLKLLTAFSLPEGREPAHLDEWIFLAFSAEKGLISPQNIEILSSDDGRSLINLGHHMRGSQNRDDDRLYELIEGLENTKKLQANLLLWNSDFQWIGPRVQDRSQVLVAHTSCVSCHKLNPLRFDFHNFGYLEDRELSISPRVHRDVALDLLWLKKRELLQHKN